MAVKTMLDVRISRKFDGIPGGQIKLVRGDFGNDPDYALFVDEQYLASLPDVQDDQDAILKGLEAIHRLVKLLMYGEPPETVAEKLWEKEEGE